MTQDQNKISTLPPFKSLLKLEGKRVSVYTLSAFITQLGSFLVVPLFWQKLSPSDYGIIAITEIVGSVLGVIFGLQIDTYISRFYYEWPEQERKQKVGANWVASWISSVVLGCVSFFFLLLFSPLLFKGVTFYPFIFYGLINAILKSFTIVPFATIRIKQLPALYSILNVVTSAMQLSLNIYFVLILNLQLTGYFVSNVIGNSITVVVLGAIMLMFASPCIRGGGLRETMKFSLPLIPSGLIGTLSSVVDKFILQQFASLETLGVYAICLKFSGLITSLHSTLKLSYVPFMVESLSENRERGISNLARMSVFYVLPLMMLGLAISAYINDFVHFANRSDYLPVIKWIPWLIWATILQNVNVYFTPGLFLSKRTDLMWIPPTIQLVVILVAGFLLIPDYQMEGAVITRYCSAISIFAISLLMTKKYYPIPVNWIKVLFLTIIMVSGTIVVRMIDLNNIVVSIATKALFIACLCLICFAIIVVSPRHHIDFSHSEVG